MMLEQWRPVVGWEDLYEVSSLGRMRSRPRRFRRKGDGAIYDWPGKVLSTRLEYGWPSITLARPGKNRRYRVAYLVVEAFTDWQLSDAVIRFVNEDPTDARLTNLRLEPISTNEEHWRPCIGFDGSYEVSDLGRIRSVLRTVIVTAKGKLHHNRIVRPCILRPAIDKQGYPHVALMRHGRLYTRKVHRLVCEAFHGPRPPKHDVCHRDGDPLNNTPTNLYWGTRLQNMQEMYVQQFARMARISLQDAWAMIDCAQA